jgi:hypothetical protein
MAMIKEEVKTRFRRNGSDAGLSGQSSHKIDTMSEGIKEHRLHDP